MAAVLEKAGVRPLTEQGLRTGLGYTRIYRALLAGQVPAFRQGGRWYLRDADADRFATDYRAAATHASIQPA